jgi:3',5'-cyclic AMP phosphodiesterase CpdA
MRLAHLSDLHFGGSVSKTKADALALDLAEEAPDLIVSTGDITDQGTLRQFRRAFAFFQDVGRPLLSVPGNREIGVMAFWEWLIPPLAMGRYASFFGQADRVFYEGGDPNVAFFGVNSVHPFPSWLGSVRRETRYWLRSKAAQHPDSIKVLFLHHPVLPVLRSSSFWAHGLSDAGELLHVCSQTGFRLILQGHKHRSAVMELSLPQYDCRLVVSACGAPLLDKWDSVYHLIDIDAFRIVVSPRQFTSGRFQHAGSYEFALSSVGRSSASGRLT